MSRLHAALVVLAAFFAACGGQPSAAQDAAEPLARVRYLVSVAAPPRSFENRHAQTITLEAAYLSYASLVLGRCAPVPPSAGAALLRQVFGVPRARAGHDGVLDLSYADDGWVLDLRVAARGRLLAERFFPPTAYCRVQSVLAGAHDSYAGYPDGANIRGYTLHVRGQFATAGVSAPFVLETDLPYGKLSELRDASGRGRHASLSVAHDLRAALQDIDLAREPPEPAAKRLLRALVDNARLSFTRSAR